MSNVLRTLVYAVVVCGSALLVQGTASAHGGHSHSHGGYFPSTPRFHDTSHFHYHPGGFQQHGNHFHYVPGHFDLHRTGHWHW